MPSENALEEKKFAAGGNPGSQLDKVLECLGSINERLDSIETEDKKREDAARRDKRRRDGDAGGGSSDTLADKMQALDDAIEGGDKDEIEKAHEDLKEHLRADVKKRKDAKRGKDDDDDEEEPNRDRARGEPKKVVADSLIADNKRRELMAAIQQRADRVANAFGEEADKPMSGERPSDYRRRLLRKFLPFSRAFKDVDLHTVPNGEVFDGLERQVFADAEFAANDVQSLNASATGFLRKIVRKDDGGRNIVEYFGTPRMWLEQFCCPVRRVVKINKGGHSVPVSEIIG
jgi:hypothetical protein